MKLPKRNIYLVIILICILVSLALVVLAVQQQTHFFNFAAGPAKGSGQSGNRLFDTQ